MIRLRLVLALVFFLRPPAAGSSMAAVTYHNSSDCCCQNIYPRSAKNLVRTASECAANCAADASCHAAVLITAPSSDVQRQCQLDDPAAPGLGCCIHKRHYDGISSSPVHGGSTVIDMGTSSGGCPGHGPIPPTPQPGACSGECRRPWYHFTAGNLTTSDPNGLQWRRTETGAISYEYFHQDRNTYTKTHPSYCWGSEGGGGAGSGKPSAWGRASSPDLLHWKTEAVSGVCGSSGGGVTLPPDFRGPHGERWTSAMVASAPGATPMDTNGTGRGLKLWVSNDTGTSMHYSMYLPPGTQCHAEYHLCSACVICPKAVREGPSNPPAETLTAFLGDSATWSEPPWNVPSTNRTFYVLSGSGTCPGGIGKDGKPKPSEFCGWGGDRKGGGQALLFSSKNLVDWKYVSQFFLNSRAGNEMPPNAGQGSAIMTPDTFTFPSGEQAFIYLGQKNTRWITGNVTRGSDGDLEKFVERGFGGNPTTVQTRVLLGVASVIESDP